MPATAAAPSRDHDAVDPTTYGRALLNVLADFGEEKAQLQGTQRAILNILGDANDEAMHLHKIHGAMLNLLNDSESGKVQLEATERAVINILDDSEIDKAQLRLMQRAALNILDDTNAEARHLHNIQGAMLNILDDFESDKARLAATERAAVNILDDAEADKTQLKAMQRAALNILDDFDADKSELRGLQRASLNILEDVDLERRVRGQAEAQVRALNEALEARVLQRTAALTMANQELETFAYSVAHDLRAPLRAIDGFSEIIMEDHLASLNEDGKDALRRVRQGAQRMGLLIDDMLALSHSTQGVATVEQVDLSAIAELEVTALRRSEPTRDTHVSIGRTAVGLGDSRLLRSVLENLLSNAWKFTAHTPNGTILFSSEERGDEVIYRVQDNGAGFDMAFAHNLFRPFQRLHRSSEFPGNGIGLATVKRIIGRMGGTVGAEGSVDKGATFYFTLPRARTGREEAGAHE